MAANLDYLTPLPGPPRTLTLEDAEGCVHVIFAVPPKWTYLLPIVIGFSVGLFKLIAVIAIVTVLWRTAPKDPELAAAVVRIEAGMLLVAGISVFVWWTIAAYHLWMYRRWGRVPRTLTAGNEGLILTWLGFLRIRERHWPAREIAAVEVRLLRWNLNWKRPMYVLRIIRHKGRRLRFLLPSLDVQLPGQIGQRFAETLGCPLLMLAREDTSSHSRHPTSRE